MEALKKGVMETIMYPIALRLFDKYELACKDYSEKEAKEILWRMMTTAEVFLVEHGLMKQNFDEVKIKENPDSDVEEFIDLPFKCCWLEYTGDFIGEGPQGSKILGAAIEEISPGKYRGAEFFLFPQNQRLFYSLFDLERGKPSFGALQGIWKKISSMNMSQWGEAKANIREKVSDPSGAKAIHKVKRVIYVRPRGLITTHIPAAGRTILWDCSWLVRGHWRRFDGLGKDRAGVRCVENATWVVPHKKGQGGLKHVTRIVQQSTNTQTL